jgi:RNA polymerase sigma-70 factor (ECF subfamily)
VDAALGEIYREHFEFVSCVLHRFGVASADLDDAAQDVFVIAHGKLADFEGRAAVRTWLYSIAMRVASNRRRKHARRDALLSRLPRVVPEDLEELAARGQARAILESLLARLDEHKRVVFVLAELEELTVPNIAEIVGENPRTIYSRLRAARARVATELDRLQLGLDDAVIASRVRPSVPRERAQRVWAGVVMTLAGPALPVPIAAGLSLWAKLAIGAAVATGATVAIVVATPTQHDDTPRVAALRDPTPAPVDAPAIAAPPPVAAPVEHPPPADPVPPHATAPRVRSPEPPAVEPPRSSTLADETAAIDRARGLVAAGRTDDAIAELDRYAARFESGVLHRDAAAVRITALCKAGREADAIAIATAEHLPTPRCR